MQEERTWRTELTWWLSALLTLLAVLLPVAALEGTSRALRDPGAVDRFNEALGWTIILPAQVLVTFLPFYLSGALSCRLLVPTFAGVHPRIVAAVFCTAAAVFGVYLTTLDWLTTFGYGSAALVWALVMPLPLKDLLRYGPVVGGLIVGLGLATLLPWATPSGGGVDALLHSADGALIAIIWCCWRLYRDHPTEVAVTAITVAVLPILLMIDDPRGTISSASGVYTALETMLLLLLAGGGLVLSRVAEPTGDSAAPSA